LIVTTALLLGAVARADPVDLPLPVGAVRRLGVPRPRVLPRVYRMAATADGKIVAACSAEGPLHVWDLVSRQLRAIAPGKEHAFSCLAFSPEGLTLAVGDNDAVVQLRETAGGEVYRTLRGHGGTVTALAFAPNGRTLASGGADRTVILWSDRGTLLRRLEGHRRDVLCLAFTPDGRGLASGSEDGTVRVWDVATGGQRLELAAAGAGPQALVMTPDGKGLVAEGADHALRLWDLAAGREVRSFRGHSDRVLAVAVTRGGETLASGSADGTVRLWDVAAGTEKRLFRSKNAPPVFLTFSPDGKSVAAHDRDGFVDLWPLEGETRGGPVAGHRGTVDAVAFSADGREVITRAGTEVFRWDLASGRLLGTAEEKPPPQEVVEARSPDGKIVLTPSVGGAVLAREAATGETIFELHGHAAPVTSLAFAADSRSFVSGSADTSAVVWDLLECLPSPGPRQRGPWMKDLDLLWGELEKEGASAFQALRLLSSMPDKTLPFLKGKVPYLAEVRRLRQLVADLDDDAFAVREAASRDLAKVGLPAEAALRQALRDSPSAEVKRRALLLLERVEEDETAVLCWRRAVWLLEMNGSPEARRVLEAVAAGTLGEKVTQDARAALARLDRRGKGR
jgi:WD40 repeat protein